ncbi:MMPL family transporter [Cellulomonas sp. P22]|uniref:MMPL family transporter n=1 Tax=Cellulomonas sp. P22 TaxID=3373189 RepID=UPI0037B4B784
MSSVSTPAFERAAAQRPPSPPRRDRVPGAQRIARWSATHRWAAIGLWVLFVAATLVGGLAAGTRSQTAAEQGTGESGRVDIAIEQAGFPPDTSERVFVQAPAGSTLSDADLAAVTADLHQRWADLSEVASTADPIRSADGRSALIPLTIDVGTATGAEADTVAADRVVPVIAATDAVAALHPELAIHQLGSASLGVAINEQVSGDFERAEMLSLPVTFVILLLAFGAIFAAGVPVLLALSAVGSAIGLAALVSHLIPATDTLSSVVLLVGMAVGVDYSLFYVRRMREEIARGVDRRSAIDIAAATSGRAVVTSGLAVIVSMAGLFFAGAAVFTSMAVGTMLVVAVAVLGSLTVLPALLSLLGDRLDRPRVPLLHRLSRPGKPRFWPVAMRVVLRKPAVSLVVAGLALVGLALPVLGMKTGEASMEAMGESVPALTPYTAMTAAFPQEGSAHTVGLWSSDDDALDLTAISAATDQLVADAQASGLFADLSGVALDVAPDGRTARIDLPVAGDPTGSEAAAALALLRDDLVPTVRTELPGVAAGVTGGTAQTEDFGDALSSHLPLVIAFVVAISFAILVLAFRSVVVAATAIVLNVLSVGAAYGLLVLVFQHGVGADLLGVTNTGFVVDWLPLFLFVILFGLSMDYHVFVVSRIREEHVPGVSTRTAVARGVTASAGVVTSAAVVMVAVFAIFASLSLIEFMQLGIGLAAAVIIDATVVRAVLLPSAMTLLGRHNWWLPGWLDRVLPAAHA